MAIKSLGNPYDEKVSLQHTQGCKCSTCTVEKASLMLSNDAQRTQLLEKEAEKMVVDDVVDAKSSANKQQNQFDSSEDMLDQAIENAIVRGVFNHNDMERRTFM